MSVTNSRTPRQALCCECGQLRTCALPRNHILGGWGLHTPFGDGHREVCELKCDHCGRRTRHALLMRLYQTHDEDMQLVALGDPHEGYTPDQLDMLRDNYRKGLPRNPFLEHMFYTSDLEKARADGSLTARTLCGEVVAVDDSRFDYGTGYEVRAYRKPEEVRDQEYEDPRTGLWWVEQDCVDCLRVSNQIAARSKRDELLDAVRNLLVNLNSYDTASVERLLSAVQAVTR
ncbi:hypothetical protein [Mycobacteroides chelonae]|uniref:hypothetical protein n=1 Tax=Mycobacteroides chelonae TaxID=1774 RepID=UPI000AACD77A|nr:hypothetical protein [Mycobacteroides chelonae]